MGIGDGWYRSQPLAGIALRFGGEPRERAASAAVDALLEPGPASADYRASIVEQLASVLSPPLISRLLIGIQSFEEWGRIRALKALFPVARSEHLGAALDAIRNLSNDKSKAELLPLLLDTVDDKQLVPIVDAAETITDPLVRVPVLEAIASRVKGSAHDRVVTAASRLPSPEHHARVLARLLSISPQRAPLVTQVRRQLADYLHDGPRSTRADLLKFLNDRHVVGQPRP